MRIKKRIKRIEKMIKTDREQFKQFLNIFESYIIKNEANIELDTLLKLTNEKGKRYKQYLNIG